MLQNDTPASPTGGAGIKKQTLFGANSTSNTSATFSAGPDPYYVRAFNLNTGDTVTIQAVGGTGSGSAFASFAPLGSPVVLTPATPQARLDWPGQYRLIFSGSSVTSILVEGFAAASGEPTIYTYGGGGGSGGGFNLVANDTQSIDLTYTGTSAGGTLIGAVKVSSATGNILSSTGGGLFANVSLVAGAPLQLSGDGSAGTPYDITANIFPMPVTNLSDWPNTFITAINLEGILYVTDTPYQMANLGVAAGEHSSDSVGEACVGYHAGVGVKGFHKVAIGTSALEGATTSAAGNFGGDIAIGHNAAQGITKHTTLSQASVFIGATAGQGATYSAATFVGRGAGSTTNSTTMVAIGDSAGAGMIGDNNTVLGNLAGTGPVTTNNSVFIGAESGEGIAAGDGIIAIGRNAGTAALQSIGPNLNGCMYIGSFAGSHDTHQDVIIIASDATTATNSTAPHQIILGKASHTELRTAGSVISGGSISASDSRLKDNVSTITDEAALEFVEKIRPVMFHWDKLALANAKVPYREVDCGIPISGFIAQEIEQIAPEVITPIVGGDGQSYKFVHHDRLLGYAFAAIKALADQNRNLINRLDAIEAKLDIKAV